MQYIHSLVVSEASPSNSWLQSKLISVQKSFDAYFYIIFLHRQQGLYPTAKKFHQNTSKQFQNYCAKAIPQQNNQDAVESNCCILQTEYQILLWYFTTGETNL